MIFICPHRLIDKRIGRDGKVQFVEIDEELQQDADAVHHLS